MQFTRTVDLRCIWPLGLVKLWRLPGTLNFHQRTDTMFCRTSLACAILIIAVCFLCPTSPRAHGVGPWPQFRGAKGAGVADGSHLPVRWSVTENVAWSIEVPGRGWSSPIFWGNKIFVTSAISPSSFKKPQTGIFGSDYIAELTAKGLPPAEVNRLEREKDIETTEELTADVQWMVYCIDADTGRIEWAREAYKGKPVNGRHRKNSFASETPVTDGERIYAYFGNVGLFCYSMKGDLLWTRKWDPHKMYLDFGTASSPVLHGDRIYIQNDNEEDCYLASVDKKTGEEMWRVARNAGTGRKSDWATPYVWENALRTEVIAIGRGQAISYGLDGKELWHLKGLKGQAAPLAVSDSSLLYVGTGDQTGVTRPMFAVRPGATGDISLNPGETGNAYVAWSLDKASAYMPSPLVYGNRMYVIYDNGICAAFESSTGKQIYKARIGTGATFSSSPCAADGNIFCLSEDGDTFVIKAGDEYQLIAQNSLGEMCLATPAIADGSLFIRTMTKLYRIARAGSVEGPRASHPMPNGLSPQKGK
jgi:outer membrane protein assembly factor BamB